MPRHNPQTSQTNSSIISGLLRGKEPIEYRRMTGKAENIDKDERIVEFAFASEFEAERYWGIEILNIRSGKIRLDRLNSGGSCLYNHNEDFFLGRVLEAWKDGGLLRCKVKFSENPDADAKYRDIVAGLLTNVSFGYSFKEINWIGERDGVDIWSVDDFEPFEVSFCTIALDYTVGSERSNDINNLSPEKREEFRKFLEEKKNKQLRSNNNQGDDMGRHSDQNHNDNNNHNNPPPTHTGDTRGGGNPHSHTHQISVEDSKELEYYRSHLPEIQAMGAEYGYNDLANEFIKNKRSVSEFQKEVLKRVKDNYASQGEPAPDQQRSKDPIGMSEKEIQNFSILRALTAHDMGDWRGAGLEKEVITESMRKYDSEGAKGSKYICIPPDVLRSAPTADMSKAMARSLNHQQRNFAITQQVTDPALGGHTVGDDLMSLIEVMQSKLMLKKMGATTLNDLSGNITWPVELNNLDGKGQFLKEGDPSPQVHMNFDVIQSRPRRFASHLLFTRRLMIQSSLDVEAYFRAKMARSVAYGIDWAAIFADGSGENPSGILQQMNPSHIIDRSASGANPLGIEDLILMETLIANNDAEVSTMKYFTNPSMRGYFKGKSLHNSVYSPMWAGDVNSEMGMLNGYGAYASTIMKPQSVDDPNYLTFGDWSKLIIGEWGALFLKLDDTTLADRATIRILVDQELDIVNTRPNAFCAFKLGGAASFLPKEVIEALKSIEVEKAKAEKELEKKMKKTVK